MKGLSSKNKRRFSIFIILGVFCYSILFHFARITFLVNKNTLKTTFSTSVKELDNKSPESLLVYKTFKAIENEDISSAMKYIDEFVNTYNDVYMNAYLCNFKDYVIEKKKKNRKPIFFFNEMPVFTEYLVTNYKESKKDAERYSEVVPFYILKTYEKEHKCSSNLCDIFIQNSAINNHLSKKAAIILCLKIRTIYEDDGLVKNKDRLKSIQDIITMYKQNYPNELNNNPNYMDEIKWLDTFYSFLTDRINNPVIGIFSRMTFNKNIKGLGE